MSYLSYHEGTAQTGGGAFQSMTDALDPAPGIVPKQHFVEKFSGSALDSIWTFVDGSGTGSGAMNDVVNGGYQIVTGTSSSNWSGITFNDINHYEPTGSVFITLNQAVEATSRIAQAGFIDTTSFGHFCLGENDSSNTFLNMITKGGGSQTTVNSSIAFDENLHRFDLLLNATSNQFVIDGILEAIATTNLPTADLQPLCRSFTRTAAARSANFLYCEVFNT